MRLVVQPDFEQLRIGQDIGGGQRESSQQRGQYNETHLRAPDQTGKHGITLLTMIQVWDELYIVTPPNK